MHRLYTLAAATFVGAIVNRHLRRGSPNRSLDDEDGTPVTDPEWQWPTYDHVEDQNGHVETTKRTLEPTDKAATESPFHVIYRSKAKQLWPDVVQIVLLSAPLIKIVRKYLAKNGDLQSLAKPTIEGRELFVVLEELKNHQSTIGCGVAADSEAGKDVVEGELHLKHLVRFMEKEYNDVTVRVQRMAEEKRVPWDLLWAFLPRGKKVVYNCDHSEEPLCAVVSANFYFYDDCSSSWVFLLELEVWDYDGCSYHKCEIRRQIKKYEGERSFASVAVRPIDMAGDPNVLEKEFLANGKRFYELAVKSHQFVHYTGPMFQQRLVEYRWQLFKENANGRVMIDLSSFATMNPGYPMGSAQPPTASVFWLPKGDDEVRFQAPVESRFQDTDVSDESLIFAPALVYGFSFTLKQWGCFAIKGFREISFDSNAFDELVMESETKGLVYNLVRQYIATPLDEIRGLQRIDPISNKGECCVFLCYGPPGTGKTLTAESVAESMRRPLWALSVSELGTTPNDLEKTLVKILDIAATWQAVLLLDEADVYLEKRTSSADITRNAMTGVFLRVLEYYRGVLFLTTNRIGTFDDAFRSRISMFLRYDKLDVQHKVQVWKTLLARARVEDVAPESLRELAREDLNGREIRNAIHTAQTWANSKTEPLELRHVQYVMNIVVNSLNSLKDAVHTAPKPYIKTNGTLIREVAQDGEDSD